jgi:hypothetical protein
MNRMLRSCAIVAVLCLPALAGEGMEDAITRMYDFDFQTSHQILDRYIAEHPAEPLPYAFRASAYLFSELDRMGILESDFFTDDDRIAERKKKLDPDPEIRKSFLKAIADVESRAIPALKANPNDRDALFAMCVASGVSTDYMAFVEKRQVSSLSIAKKSNAYAQRLLKIDPKFYDAYLTAGVSEYMIGSLPFFIRWFVHFDNVEGNKQKGIERLELVAREGHFFRPFSKILLAVAALRDKRPRDAQKLLAELAHDYPGNPLFRKELTKVSNKLGVAGN